MQLYWEWDFNKWKRGVVVFPEQGIEVRVSTNDFTKMRIVPVERNFQACSLRNSDEN